MIKDRTALAERIVAQAHCLGFHLAAITHAGPATTADHYHAWLAAGYHGEMAYLARPDAVTRRANLALTLPGVRSVLTVAANYHTGPLPPEQRDDPARGIVASYAWGADYHDVLTPRLHELASFVESQVGEEVACRAYVDTGPLLERELAARAGLGFVGKNTNLIHPHLGSWLFLGELLLTVELLAWPSPTGKAGACGSCTRCLDACPTGALVAPYILDARRCISYLTIELKGPIPRALRPLLGNRIFGCDICQEVCPWNRRFARPSAEPAFQPRPGSLAPQLADLMALNEAEFRRRFGGSPLERARRRGLLRNVVVALGNWGDPAAIPALARALHDSEPLIRGHAAWALGQVATAEAQRVLEQAQVGEADDFVQEELAAALRTA